MVKKEFSQMLKTILFTIFITALVCLHCTGQQTVKEHNEILFPRVDSLLLAAVKNHEIPGAVAFISYEGTIYHRSFGKRNVETGTRLDTNDIFRMASMTKGLTAVAILQLVEQNKIHLNDRVSTYIPEFAQPTLLVEVLPDSTFTSIPAENEITIHQLLTHTSGLGYGFQDDRYNSLIVKNGISEGFGNDSRTSMQNTQLIAKLPLLCEPGTKFIYSLSFDVLGTVVEVVSGKRFDVYIKENILSPLKMSSSYFIVPEDQWYRIPTVYQPASNGKRLEVSEYPDTHYPKLNFRQYFSGGGDLCSTAEDYSHFLQMLQNNGMYIGNRILGKEWIKSMLSKQTPLGEDNSYQGYAAWITNKKGAKEDPKSEGAYDFGGFFDTYSWVDPGQNLTAILLMQMYPTNAHHIHEKFQEIVYKSIP